MDDKNTVKWADWGRAGVSRTRKAQKSATDLDDEFADDASFDVYINIEECSDLSPDDGLVSASDARSHHFQSKSADYECRVCQQTFASAIGWRIHEKHYRQLR